MEAVSAASFYTITFGAGVVFLLAVFFKVIFIGMIY